MNPTTDQGSSLVYQKVDFESNKILACSLKSK